MVGMPAWLALSITAAPVSESRLTISSTLTPVVIMPSAMVWNLALSPSAFWMSASTPAFAKASPRNWRSAVSQRADDAVSGRITPTFPFAAEGLALSAVSAVSSLPHPTSARAHALITASDLRYLVDMRWFLSAVDSSTSEERRPGRAGTVAPYVVFSNLGSTGDAPQPLRASWWPKAHNDVVTV